jgi:hypothetical protein
LNEVRNWENMNHILKDWPPTHQPSTQSHTSLPESTTCASVTPVHFGDSLMHKLPTVLWPITLRCKIPSSDLFFQVLEIGEHSLILDLKLIPPSPATSRTPELVIAASSTGFVLFPVPTSTISIASLIFVVAQNYPHRVPMIFPVGRLRCRIHRRAAQRSTFWRRVVSLEKVCFGIVELRKDWNAERGRWRCNTNSKSTRQTHTQSHIPSYKW